MNVIVCGVSGSGKTTIGKKLAEELALPFHDADDFHPPANIEKMAGGTPLEDEDRLPWLEALAGKLQEWQESGGAVLACSALKEDYREILGSRVGADIQWLFLDAPEAVIAERLASRKGHFFDRRLLRYQFEALEIPDDKWRINAVSSPDEVVNTILERLRNT